MADSYVVAIVYDNGDFSVTPSDLLAKVQDQVTFKALNTDVTITFQNQYLFRQHQVTLKSGEQVTFTVQNVPLDAYSYDVQSPIVLRQGIGATRPRIIIYN
jgi:hypothetical protein